MPENPTDYSIMEQPLVSILMTSYNAEKYIGTAIESVLASTYTHLELIVVDDVSKDSTASIAESYQQKDKRVKVYRNESNLGDYPNRNKAASLAKGKYIKYVDGDDYLYPWGLDILVNCMEAHPEAGWGLCSLPQFIGQPFPFVLSPAEAYRYHYFGSGLFHKAPLSAIIKRSVFEEVGGFPPETMISDFRMWHRLARKYPVALISDGVVWYREHEGQQVKKQKKYRLLYEDVIVEALSDPACPLNKEEKDLILQQKRKGMLRLAIKNTVKGKLSAAGSDIKAYRLFRN